MVREGAKKDSRRVNLTSVTTVTMDATVAVSADRNRRILSVFAAVSNPREYYNIIYDNINEDSTYIIISVHRSSILKNLVFWYLELIPRKICTVGLSIWPFTVYYCLLPQSPINLHIMYNLVQLMKTFMDISGLFPNIILIVPGLVFP